MTTAGPWKVISIELSEGVPELHAASGLDGVYVVFLWCGVALGHQQFLSAQLPLTPNQLAVSAAQAIAPAAGDYLFREGFRSPLPGLPEQPLDDAEATLHALLTMTRPMDRLTQVLSRGIHTFPVKTISVAICTQNRPRELARCIESVLACSEAPLEIIVVDNAPETDATIELMSRFSQVRYHREPRKGLSAARNAALAIAAGDIIAFADDDVVVSHNWITHLHRSFSDPRVMVVTGLILPAELETPAQMMFEQTLHYFHQGYRARYFGPRFFYALKGEGVPVWSLGAGANMAIRREAFRRGYLFDTRLGPGVFGGCGEDSAYWYNLLADGWACVYDPSVMVYHHHRRDLESLRRQVRQYMQGHVAALLLQFSIHRDRGNLKRLFLVLPRMYLTLLQRLILTGFSLDNRILFSGVLGCFSGLRFAFIRKRTAGPR